MTQPAILCVGETLWDILPGGEFIGGAAFNVAAHAAQLGARARLVTRVGNDDRGQRALAAAATLGIDTTLVQSDTQLATGEAHAVVDHSGSAHYEFLTPAAWDALVATPPLLRAASECDAFIYGTLGQRDPRSHASIVQIAAAARWRVFDPNLRAPHISRELCEAGMQGAALVKINEDECRLFAQWYGTDCTPEALWDALSARFAPGALCVTLGAAGSRLWWQGHWHRQGTLPVQVADTIGAGDAFLAMLVCELLSGSDTPIAMARAARLAAFVASQAGAVPAYDGEQFRRCEAADRTV